MSAIDRDMLAERVAARGRAELVARFEQAYAHAVGAHADLVSVSPEQVAALVSASVAEADGLQWRRALAGVAAQELGIELGPALTHPAVARAHELVGAPSYEGALAQLAVPAPPPDPAPAPDAGPAEARVGSAAPPEREPVATRPEPAAEPAPVAATPSPGPVVAAPEPEPVAEPESVTGAAIEPPASLDEPTQLHDTLGAAHEPIGSLADVEPTPDAQSAPDAQPAADAEAAPAAEVGPEPEPVADEVIAHRADEFAAEFMSSSPRAEREPEPAPEPAPAPTSASSSRIGPASEPTEPHHGLPARLVDVDDDDDDPGTFEHERVDAPGEETEFSAVHLGGVASLPTGEVILVRLSAVGLDLVEPDGMIVGRLGWSDIAALEVTVPHGRRRRREPPRLVVHTAGGSARFEVPSFAGDDLRARVEPMMARFGRR